ncbi:P-loop containing nucleoside triphosphate hydrolase protein [Trichoderma sp. SZMC 28013]
MSTTQPPKPHNLFIQMSGAPGSGKSTIAAQLGRWINGVVIDHDVFRSSLIESGIPFEQAAQCAYRLQWAQAQHIIEQGLSVIVDSTCNYQDILDRGSALANQHDYTYWYIECKVQDIDLLDERLRTRDPMTSQRTGVDRPPAAAAAAAESEHAAQDSRALFKKWMESPFRPKDNVVIVDSTRSPDTLRDEILKQITGGME